MAGRRPTGSSGPSFQDSEGSIINAVAKHGSTHSREDFVQSAYGLGWVMKVEFTSLDGRFLHCNATSITSVSPAMTCV